MTGEIPKELRIIGNHVALRVGLIILAIGSIILLAVLFKSGEPKICISPEQVKELCVANDIDLRKCKVKRPYIVLPKGSQ